MLAATAGGAGNDGCSGVADGGVVDGGAAVVG